MRNITDVYDVFHDDDGTPLEAGFVYIGDAGTDPKTNPKDVFFDSDMSIQAPQPLRTLFGRIVQQDGTSATNIYVDGDYSITVEDRNNLLVSTASKAKIFATTADLEAQQASQDAALTAENIKTLYEGNDDTNALSDVNLTKLEALVTPDPFENDSFSHWVTLGLTGPSSGNVVQSFDVDTVATEIHCLQVDESAGNEGMWMRVVGFDGRPIDTGYETSIAGTPEGHQGLAWEAPYYWIGGDNSNTNKVIRVERGINDDTVEYPFDLTLTDVSGETYDGNITIAVAKDADLIAIRATQVSTDQDAVFIGSWSGFKASSTTWQADSFFVIDADQDLTNQFFQGLAINRNFVWIWTGSDAITKNKFFYTYDHVGNVLRKKRAYPGHNYSTIEGDKLEPEGIQTFADSTGAMWLGGVMCTGTSGDNISRIYCLGDAKARLQNPFGGPVRRSNDVNDVLRRRTTTVIIRKEAGVWGVLGDTPFEGAPTEVRSAGWNIFYDDGTTPDDTGGPRLTITPPVGNFKSIYRYVPITDHTLQNQHIVAAVKQEGNSANFDLVFQDMHAARGTTLDPTDALISDGTEVNIYIEYGEIIAEDFATP